MLHRIFLAINLPAKTKAELLQFKEQWVDLPARWTTPENLHVTLVFLGNTSNQELEEVKRIIREVGVKHEPFSFSFQKIVYGPNPKQPRMIWAAGKPSLELQALQRDLEKSLAASPGLSFVLENHPFSLHITLARLNEWEFRKIEPEERPEINKDIHLEVTTSSFEIMESKLKRGGTEYTILGSIPLKI